MSCFHTGRQVSVHLEGITDSLAVVCKDKSLRRVLIEFRLDVDMRLYQVICLLKGALRDSKIIFHHHH